METIVYHNKHRHISIYMYWEVRVYESGEDYLEAIVALEQKMKSVRPVDVAKFLQLSKPSVSRAMKVLTEHGYITHVPYGTICLTDKGREKGTEILSRHTFLTKFLIEIINVDEDLAQKEACRMEHVLSQQTMSKLKAFYISYKEVQ